VPAYTTTYKPERNIEPGLTFPQVQATAAGRETKDHPLVQGQVYADGEIQEV